MPLECSAGVEKLFENAKTMSPSQFEAQDLGFLAATCARLGHCDPDLSTHISKVGHILSFLVVHCHILEAILEQVLDSSFLAMQRRILQNVSDVDFNLAFLMMRQKACSLAANHSRRSLG